MQLIQAALRHPITVMIVVIGIVLGSLSAIGKPIAQGLGLPWPDALPLGMEVDIFPALDLPVIYVCQPYGGMDPAQMEGYLKNYYEYHFLYISGIHHVESRNIAGIALMKLTFHPGTDMSQAMAETINYARIRSPYAGTISQRNIDTGHFVQPGAGSQPPLFVVERIDTLRVAVDVPEREAVHVQVGSTPWIQVPSLGKVEFEAKVSRTSWVLDPASRTLRVEIDLSNSKRPFRPGMYAKARMQLSVPPTKAAPAETQSR